MRVVTAHTMQAIDRLAIDELGVAGLKLMENAGRSCAAEIVSQFGDKGRALVIAGKGNNGGDGYVIARLLSQRGWDMSVCVLAEPGQISGDAAINLARLPQEILHFCPEAGQLTELHKELIFQADLIVDAMLGTGLRSDITGVYMEAIELINASGRPVVSVDIHQVSTGLPAGFSAMRCVPPPPSPSPVQNWGMSCIREPSTPADWWLLISASPPN